MLMQLPPPPGALHKDVARETAPLHRVLVIPDVQPLITVSTRPACALAAGASNRQKQRPTAMMVFIALLLVRFGAQGIDN
jgi:hypothetical protein